MRQYGFSSRLPFYAVLVHRLAITLYASFLRSVTLSQLRFTLLTVTSSQRDLHPQVCAPAGRTSKKGLVGKPNQAFVQNSTCYGLATMVMTAVAMLLLESTTVIVISLLAKSRAETFKSARDAVVTDTVGAVATVA